MAMILLKLIELSYWYILLSLLISIKIIKAGDEGSESFKKEI